IFFDVAYDPWPTPLAAAWLAAGGRVISGLGLLVYQALAQVRIFVNGDPDSVLPAEGAVLAAMRSSVGLRGTSR
ncbi:MAG: shikimate dehydrogenase, partial [Lacisediminihabitans sp.]